MAFTPLLGLSLPVTGSLSGTWGDEINNSITSLVDSAVAGTTTLSTDADVTLTTTSGVANTAREAILLCTGARTGVRYITAPATSKTYTVINATTGGYNVYIRGAGPTAGIAVPMGYSVKVAWNGSDFVQMSVPVSNVSGLGTGVATALGISVGTAGSPVVNGGALGTPSSGTLTSATGLPISTGVSGLGTGVATALAVNVGTAGAPVVNGGALGTPSSGTVTNLTGTANITATGGASGAIAATTLSASSTVSGTGFSTYLASPPAIGGTAPAAVSATSLTDSGNLNFTGTGNRITGDFSNATIASRVLFQTSTANTSTIVQTIPSGTGTVARWNLANSSDPANASEASFAATSTEVRVESTLRGTGTYLPMTFYTGGSERVRVDTSGNAAIGKTPVAGRGLLQVNGDVEVTSLNTGQLAGLRNRIINGAMTVQQRAAVTVSATYQYGQADRHMVAIVSGTSISGSIVSSSGSSTSSGYAAGVTSASWTTGNFSFQHRIESLNSFSLNGKVITVSCKIYQNTGGARNFSIQLVKPTSTSDTFSALTTLQTVSVGSVPNSGYTTVSATFAALGASDASLGLGVIVYDSDSANTVVSKAYLIGDLQLELGSVATPFEQRPYGMELGLCQRYFERMTYSSTQVGPSGGYAQSSTVCYMSFPISPKRTSATAVFSGAGTAQAFYSGGTTTNITMSTVYGRADRAGQTCQFTTAAVLTTNQTVQFYASGGDVNVDFSAEL